MVRLTERAKAVLVDLRVASRIPPLPDAGLRVASGPAGQLELFPDTERPGDAVIEHNGALLLLIDSRLARALARAVIDCRFTSAESTLVVSRPGVRHWARARRVASRRRSSELMA